MSVFHEIYSVGLNVSCDFCAKDVCNNDVINPLADLSLPLATTSVSQHQDYRRRYVSALQEGNEGEVEVIVPQGTVMLKQQDEEPINRVTHSDGIILASRPNAIPESMPSQTPITNTLPDAVVRYASLTLRIEYYLEDPRAGVMFVEPDPLVAPHFPNNARSSSFCTYMFMSLTLLQYCHSQRYPHMYTVNQPLPGGARLWLPCIDDISVRCTWEMEFIVPQGLSDVDEKMHDGSISIEEDEATVVICSGELVEQTSHPTDPSKKIVHYVQSVPTPAPFIAFAVGPFEITKFSPLDLTSNQGLEGTGENKEKSLDGVNARHDIFGFCLPGRTEELRNTALFLTKALRFYSQECGTYPFSDFKVVFVEEAWCPAMSSASLAICSTQLLYSPDVIDQAYETRRLLSLALATQWMGIHIVPKIWPDIWLIIGMANFITAIFLKKLLGNNEYRLRLKKDISRCCAMDVGRPPLYNHSLPPIDPDDLEFMELKAPLVLWMLDKRMRKGGGTLGLSRVIPKIMVAQMSGELVHNALSTHWLFKLCRKISGVELKSFIDQWIYHSGCPKFKFRYVFNRKKMVVEITMTQENTNAASGHEYSDVIGMPADETATPLFTGNLTARIHEADGTPYEHILDIQEVSKKFEVQFNTKYKRIRRNTKRFQAKQAAAAAVAAEEDILEGDEGEVAALGVIPVLGLGMPMFENETEREEWRVVEWGQGEDDISGAASATFDWIRLDAEFEWVCVLDFTQPAYMWAAQLTKDRDAVAQYEAIEALKAQPTLTASTSLLRALMDQKCFYRIRMEAAYALAKCATPELEWVGLLQLTKAFQKRFCYQSSASTGHVPEGEIPVLPCIPKPNNFSSLTEYFVQKAIPVAVSQIRDERGQAPLKVKHFLLDLLRYNDNTGNTYSDNYYVSTLISALGHSLISDPRVAKEGADGMEIDDFDSIEILEEAKREIDRYRTLDYLIPTYHNTITTFTSLMSAGLMQPDFRLYGNFLTVRMTAIDSLFILNGLHNCDLIKYFFSIICQDPCPYMSFYVARGLMKLLGLMMGNRGDRIHKDFVDDLVEEEGKVFAQDAQSIRNVNNLSFQEAVDEVRKELGSNTVLQHCLWNSLNSNPFLDHLIRKFLLRFCEVVYKPIDLGLPRLRFRMPAPAIEVTVEGEPEPESNKPSVVKSLPGKTSSHKAKLNSIPTEVYDSQVIKNDTKLTPVNNMQDDIVKIAKKIVPHSKIKKDVGNDSSISATAFRQQTSSTVTSVASTAFSMSYNESKICLRGRSKGQSMKMETKLDNGGYTSANGFYADVRLMFANCYSYNGLGSPVQVEGTTLDAYFEDEWKAEFGQDGEEVNLTIAETPDKDASKVLELHDKLSRSLSGTNENRSLDPPASTPVLISRPTTSNMDLQKCQRILKRLVDDPASYEFMKPVDPVRQCIPHYVEVIKQPMDLGTIGNTLSFVIFTSSPLISMCDVHSNTMLRLDRNQIEIWSIFEQFDFDVRLVFDNCLRFNQAGTFVYQQGQKMLEIYEQTRNEQITGNEQKGLVNVKEGSTKPKLPAVSKDVQKMRSASPAGDAKDGIQDRGITPDPPRSKNSIQATHPTVSVGKRDTMVLVKDKSHPGVPNEGGIPPMPVKGTMAKEKVLISKDKTIQTVADKPIPTVIRDKIGASIVSREKPSTRPKDAVKPASPNRGNLSSKSIPDVSATFQNATESRIDETSKAKCGKLLDKLVSHQSSQPFQQPVDVVALNIPNYPKIIKRPMDLSTIRKNLDAGKYATIGSFEIDCRQIFWNCFKFNSPDSWVYEQGKALESLFNQLWSAEFGRKDALRADDKRKAQKILQKLIGSDAANIFLEPVDLEEHPRYLEVIEHPIDLRTISEKLESGKYGSFRDLEDDIRLMFENCYTFNAPLTVGNEMGKRLEDLFDTITRELKLRTKKEALATQLPTKPKSTPIVAANITRTSPLKVATVAKAPGPTLPISPAEKMNKALQLITDVKRMDKILKKLMTHRAAAAFNRPVDPITENVPHYLEIITKPMDFSTIDRKLKAGKYKNMANFAADVRLVFANCYKFNSSEHVLSIQASSLESMFDKEIEREYMLIEKDSLSQVSKDDEDSGAVPSNRAKAVPFRSPTTSSVDQRAELKKYEQVLRKFKTHTAYHIFQEPVDAVALGIPQYHTIVERPMDFGTIEKRLRTGTYKRTEDLVRDAAQVFYNCYLFNPSDDWVYKAGQELEKEWMALCTQRGLRSGVPVVRATSTSTPVVETPLPPQEPSTMPRAPGIDVPMAEIDSVLVTDQGEETLTKKRKKEKKDKEKKKRKKHKHRHGHDHGHPRHSSSSQHEGTSSRSISPVTNDILSDGDGPFSDEENQDSEGDPRVVASPSPVKLKLKLNR
ncbi:LOW QUALITY PROTEIN: hypothetical protein BC936DRAFT_144128 [Jimgerdemannia flammicorona]|uniref:Transcription initiation factor TFIID subunit 2 n=1 Tax=Jimgerdemannia flammicorona TaxID=994334 RepID=A0A433DMB4_9FUNG|nr:LOW QUALITY PROTEIN: hypothetical protein BC936DRAFT_144128 [Jimgerdemannia flammicorona]